MNLSGEPSKWKFITPQKPAFLLNKSATQEASKTE